MMPRHPGGLLLGLLVIAGCAGPMTLPQAKAEADKRVMRYCKARSDCGPLVQTKSQRLKDRWLLDYDTSGRVLTVAVDDTGVTRLDVWNKK